jgi:anti-sigma factor RsiW
MLCHEFEENLTDYLDGALSVTAHQAFAEHVLRCPACHDLLSEVKNTLMACASSEAPTPGNGLEARILVRTMPEAAMTCEDFEAYLTDYLDGFLPAPLFHRWERHAHLCERCTELPGHVVRAIGACYSYLQDELPAPVGLEARILQATLGTVTAEAVRAPLGKRFLEWVRLTLDPIVSPQLATVATMVLLAILVLTSTISADGSISGVYSATLHLAEQTAGGASKQINEFVGTEERGGAKSDRSKDGNKDSNQK